MKEIKVLSKEIINKIAAGEVIERPVCVVKELVENSLDAEAKNIKVCLWESGMRKISVLDDGHGMSEENLKKSYLPHSTSKIRNDEDLLKIYSFGFRGEALASIATISDLLIRSRIKDCDFGKQLEISESKIKNYTTVAMPQGTEIIVKNLFKNIPARKKFLKNLQVELRIITSFIIKVALAFPSVAFSLYHNDKEILKFSANQSLLQRIEIIFGKKFSNNLIELDFEDENLVVKGFIGKPQIANKTNLRQFLFVNNRPIKNFLFCNLIKEVFGNLLEANSQPPFILFFDFLPENIDVNIHPRKQEIKFLNQNEINKSLKKAVSEILKKENLSYFLDDYNQSENFFNYGLEPHTASILRDKNAFWDVRKNKIYEKYILQIHLTYLVIETEKGLLLVDQHAAHERIIFEELLERYNQEIARKNISKLEEPVTINFSLNEFLLMKENLSIFEKLGFEIEFFGKYSFKINAIPDIFKNRKIDELILEFLTDINCVLDEFKLDSKTIKTIAYLACKNAIKAGDYLTQEERRDLIKKLQKTKSNYTCPHGRPSTIEISERELQSLFKRI